MGILCIYLGNWAKQAKNHYKLIIACNRDERFDTRLTHASFWDKPDEHILAGKNTDNNGTFLGLSKHGKLAVMLKIRKERYFMDEFVIEEIKGAHNNNHSYTLRNYMSRSMIATNFLKSPGSSHNFCSDLLKGQEYRQEIGRFHPFHFVGVDLLGAKTPTSTISGTYLSNQATPDVNDQILLKSVGPELNNSKILSFGNSPIYKPFQKIIHGRHEFIDIIEKYCGGGDTVVANESTKISLQKELLHFLRSRKRYIPDPVLSEFAKISRIQQKIVFRMGARFVTDYLDSGTRVQSLILVDADNNVSFDEWFLMNPRYNQRTPEWIHTKKEFKL